MSCVCVWSEDDVMMLLSDYHAFVFEWGWYNHFLEYIVGLWSKVNDDAVEWVSCVCVWSEDDMMMMLLSECYAFVYEVRMIWWCCWVSFMCLCIKWGWYNYFFRVYFWPVKYVNDDAVEWVSCLCVLSEDDVMMLLSVSYICVWSEDDVMMLLSECLVFVYEVRMMW